MNSVLSKHCLKVFFEPTPELLRIIVPKRAVPKAHDRNRFKRVVREYFRLHKSTIKPGKWVVVAKTDVELLENKQILADLRKQIAKPEQNR